MTKQNGLKYLKSLGAISIAAMIALAGCSHEVENMESEPNETGSKEDVQIVEHKHQKITAAKAKEMIDDGNVIILDVRTEEEFAEAHIAGATLLPDYEIEALAPEVLADKNETILVYCRSGRRSEAAAKILAQMGYANIYDFGGIIGWPYEVEP